MSKILVPKFLRIWMAALLVFAFVLGASGVRVVYAASLTVNTIDDNVTAGDGFCTLREAITNANSDSDTTNGDCSGGSGEDIISFSVSGTITLAGATLPAISDPDGLTIDGAGQSITISGNNSVQVMVVGSGAALTVQNLTIANGFSGGTGGGIRNYGTLTLMNSSFSGNSAEDFGGISNFSTLTVTNSTFSGNSATVYGGAINGFVSVLLRNTIVANSLSGGNCAGSFIDGGGNLNYPDNACPGINADPLLGPLQVNPPGDTATHALLPSSPAIDAAMLANCPATDQRGVSRPQGAGCDIGAFELDQQEDVTPPTITITTPADGATYTLGQVVNADYSCQDEAGGSGIASCVGDVPNGSPINTSSVGSKTFTVNAQDHAGNIASLTHNYSVIYNFNGFFEPVDKPPTFNVVNAGARIPVKFSLSGNQGLGIFAAGYPISMPIACPPSAPLDVIEQTLRLSGASLSYDPTTDTYNYKWRTDSAWTGTCRQLIIRLNDGTEHTAYFMFR